MYHYKRNSTVRTYFSGNMLWFNLVSLNKYIIVKYIQTITTEYNIFE